MARPAKSLTAQSNKTGMTKAERDHRDSVEKSLKGKADKLKAPLTFSKERKALFDFVIEELTDSGLLGNLDIFVLEKLCISVDMLRSIDEMIDANNDHLMNSQLKTARSMYSTDFFKCCQELCLSPQSRAKLSVTSLSKEKPKTLDDILREYE